MLLLPVSATLSLDTKIIFLYCLAGAIAKTLRLEDDPQSKMNHAEVITFVMISALFYRGNDKTPKSKEIGVIRRIKYC